MARLVRSTKILRKSKQEQEKQLDHQEATSDELLSVEISELDSLEEASQETRAVLSEDEAPESVSLSSAKASMIEKIKFQREAQRLDREKQRKKTVKLQEQNRQARLRRELEQNVIQDQEEFVAPKSQLPQHLPESIIANALAANKSIKFDIGSESSSESEAEDFETARQSRAQTNKTRLVNSLPFAVTEIGFNGRARISRAEIKARRAVSHLKLQSIGKGVRRIDPVLERARKSRSAAKVFSRTSRFIK